MTPVPAALRIRQAEWPHDLPVTRHLFESYFASLRNDPAMPMAIRDRDRGPELEALGTRYRDGSAAMLLACVGEQANEQAGEQVSGGAAVHWIAARERSAEMKRLYVLPEARGCGAGRALILACAAWARERGAGELLLDTLPAAMPGAVRLYRALGFEPTERYNENEGAGFAFFRLGLR